MLTLAFDSTAKIASAAVLDGERVLAQFTVDNGLTQSELLLPMAEDILRSLKLSVKDIELLACSVGPGSFTGVRIGVSIVKGLALERGIPTVGVSTLESLAENLRGAEGLLVPVMDARRNQVYTALFRAEGGNITRVSEDEALSLDALCEKIKNEPSVYLVGDGYEVAKRALEGRICGLKTTPPLLRGQSAASVGLCAVRIAKEGLTVKDTELLPTYLRMPQAERERLERSDNTDKGEK